MCDLDKEWDDFCEDVQPIPPTTTIIQQSIGTVPQSTELYISTKTKIVQLNTEIDIYKVFWQIPISSYIQYKEGVIKKQMKFNSETKAELNIVLQQYNAEMNYKTEYIIKHIDNPSGNVKFKDKRKISIGLCSKDILTKQTKPKGAFYNCFVINLRLLIDDCFREFHVKLFNTGEIELPGTKNECHRHIVLKRVVAILKECTGDDALQLLDKPPKNVLINSNFNCGYYINRCKLTELLKYKYNIHANYDPGSTYQGIQCKLYYNPNNTISFSGGNHSNVMDTELNTGKKQHKKMSFMIFRTGSVLIVGKCDDDVVYQIYNYLKQIFIDEYHNIVQQTTELYRTSATNKTKKKRPKKVTIDMQLDKKIELSPV